MNEFRDGLAPKCRQLHFIRFWIKIDHQTRTLSIRHSASRARHQPHLPLKGMGFINLVLNGYRAVLLLLLIIVSVPPPLSAGPLKISELADLLKSVNAMSCQFRQENYDSLQERRTHASGRFLYLQPGLMKWIYDEPDPYTIIVGNRRIWIYDAVLESVTIYDTDKTQGLNALEPVFEPQKLQQYYGDAAAESSRNHLDIHAGDKAVYLVRRKPDPNIAEIQISVGADSQIKQFVVLENNGNYRKISFQAIDTKPGLQPSDFSFDAPEGVEIIDKTKENP